MKFYPKAEKSSLAYHLKEYKLDNKLNMHIHHMFKYYERVLKETNTTTAEQMREIVEYCIIDTISCQRLMVKCNAINEYREVVSVAFISLYDSHYFAIEMKMQNLLSAETVKYPGAYVFLLYTESLKKRDKNFHEINFKYNEELLIRRNSLKRHLALLNDRKEELEKKISLTEARGEDVTDVLKSENSSVSFIIACLNAKSLALKVYINTFYSEAGNSRFPFFL
ncbi:20549_t:CDS:2 [Funneliformis geosporum]|uniref:5258_t:CDS:1 n=1 Tax=Funneliformis geosporum TaxID=1117311 RepID=A0A9W4WLU8_9GLOM|nr:20549_t:CDS:2 [Funneliformis geosporum]CAI2163534.1 5258_t:CDS:2 [Funneliformis geosporum]